MAVEINLIDVSKRFRYEWIFKKINLQFQSGRSYAISGPNGSGKSTFLKILSGHLSPTKGKIRYSQNGQATHIDDVYRKVSFTAPYIELIEEFSLMEALHFHGQFRSFIGGMSTAGMLEILNFEKSRDKQIRYFSSGMKQRLKLALCLCSEADVILLDEPTTNLDDEGMVWYHSLIQNFRRNRLLVVASNIPSDYDFCDEQINILDYK